MVENNGVQLTEHEAELYDRQIRLWGIESQKRLRASKIVICGLGGIGAEIAKNIILAGVKSVALVDDKNVSAVDSCSQFFAPVTSIGINRAEASLQRARALNPMVEIKADKESLENKKEDFFKQFDVVIVTEASTKEIVRIDNICRENELKFFCSDVWGMFGYSFADLLDHDFIEDVIKHKIISKPGEKIKTELVTTTKKSNMEFPPFQSVLDFDFKSPAFGKRMKRNGPTFVIIRILQEFRDRHGRDPDYSKRDDDIKELLKIRDDIAKGLLDDSALTNVFAQISPIAAIVGGEVAQEVIKTVSQKGAPHQNVFLLDPETCCGYVECIGLD